MSCKGSLEKPVFFEPNRVWRCYLGGKLLDKFTRNGDGADNHFPEDWLASTTIAQNGPNQLMRAFQKLNCRMVQPARILEIFFHKARKRPLGSKVFLRMTVLECCANFSILQYGSQYNVTMTLHLLANILTVNMESLRHGSY